MKVLVIGGTGTISKYIVDSLLENNHDVIVLNHHKKQLNVKTLLCDRKDYPAFIKTVRENGPYDCVYDMITFTTDDAKSSIEAYKHITKQVVFCSTVDVYSKEGKHYPITEDSPTKPRASFGYGYNKQKCEELFMDAHNKGYFKTTILRPAHTYAQGKNATTLLFNMLGSGRALNYIVDRINKEKPVILHGDGMSVWNVTHGYDTGKAFYNAMGNEKAYGQAYTICGDECMSYFEYYKAVADYLNKELKVVYIPTELLIKLEPERCAFPSENFRYNNIFDNTKAKEDLGFVQTIKWKEGIEQFFTYHNEHTQYVDSDSETYAFYDQLIDAYTEMTNQLIKRYKKDEN